MIEHIMDVKCPYCNNYFLVKQDDDNVGIVYKCINCGSYFTESELFGSKSNSAKTTSIKISTEPQRDLIYEIKRVELTDECIAKLAAAIAKELKGNK